MKLDLKKDHARLVKHVKQRIKDYPVYINMGPGADEDPIRLVTFGYEYAQGGWVCLVFDTRPNAEVDGQWTLYVEEALDFSHWYEAISALSDGTPLTITLPNGKKKTLKECDDNVISPILGMMLASVLKKETKSLSKLPLAADYRMNVEDFMGTFGHTVGEKVPQYESPLVEEIETKVKKMKPADQVAQLIQHLEEMAKGKKDNYAVWERKRIFEYLAKLGDEPVLPLLKFARKWAGKSEWIGDRPTKGIKERPFTYPVMYAIWTVRDSGCATSEVKSLLRAILRKAIKANEGRTLWGTLPRHTADCLFKLFDGYPEPTQNSGNNRLMNAEAFLV